MKKKKNANQEISEDHNKTVNHSRFEDHRRNVSHNIIENQYENADIAKIIGRIVAGSYYDMQSVRIATKNRIRDVIRKKIEGIPFDKVEEKKEKKTFKKRYNDKKLFELWDKLRDDKKVSMQEYNYVMRTWDLSNEAEKIEAKYKKRMMEYITSEDIYSKFLSKIKGIGPVISANLIKEFGNCEKYETVSKLWCHTGNHVLEDGTAPRLRKGQNIKYSPYLRKMTWIIGDCLLKQNKGIYRREYNITRKREQMLREKHGEGVEIVNEYGDKKTTTKSKNHDHKRALRAMRKLFLSHYWACGRELKGLETRELYVKEKLGHENIITWRKAIEAENCLVG